MTRGREHGGGVRRPGAETGMTLTEIAIALAILAMVVGIGTSMVSGADAGDLRAASARIASMCRAAYDKAALTGQIHRLAFEFAKTDAGGSVIESATVAVEATPEKLRFAEGESILARATPQGGALGGWTALSSGFTFASDEDEAPNLDNFLPDGIDGLLGLTAPRKKDDSFFGGDDDDFLESEVDAAFEEVVEPYALGDSVVLLDVWTEGMGETVRAGKAYIYFFPNGYTQTASIHLGFPGAEQDARAYTVELEALTGKATVSAEYVEVEQ